MLPWSAEGYIRMRIWAVTPHPEASPVHWQRLSSHKYASNVFGGKRYDCGPMVVWKEGLGLFSLF